MALFSLESALTFRPQAWKKKWFVLRTGKLAYYKDDRVRSVLPHAE